MKKHSLDRTIAILAVLCVLLLVGMGITAFKLLNLGREEKAPSPTQTPTDELLMQSDLAPDRDALFAVYDGILTGADGQTLALHDLSGHPTVLVFWSSWCTDCKQYFQTSYARDAEIAETAGARLLLVCREGVRDDTLEKAQEALASCGVSAEVWMDADAALYHAMGFGSVPSMAVLDGEQRLLYSTSELPTAEELAAWIAYADDAAGQTLSFLTEKLTTAAGGVASSYQVTQGAVAQGDTVLAESLGLLMRQAARTGDRDCFDRCRAYVRDEMSVGSLTAWQMAAGDKAQVNAALDDLRIVEALAIAEEAWGGYGEAAASRASALYDACVRDGLLRDFVELSTGKTSQDVTLCYQNVQAMLTAAAYDERWRAAAEAARALLADEAALFSADFPLYRPKYDAAKGTYTGDRVQMSEALLTVLNAAEAGVVPDTTLDWLEQALKSGPICAMYDASGSVVDGYRYESTGTYAILVQVGVSTGRETMTRLAMTRMEQTRCFDAPMVGAYGEADATTHYTFDELEALLAWRAYLR